MNVLQKVNTHDSRKLDDTQEVVPYQRNDETSGEFQSMSLDHNILGRGGGRFN